MSSGRHNMNNNESGESGPGVRGKPHKGAGKTRFGALRRVILAVCVCVMLVSGYKLVDGMLEYKRADDAYSEIGRDFVKPPPDLIVPTATPEQPSPSPAPQPPADTVTADETVSDELDPPAKPNYVDNPAPDYWPDVDFEGLRGVNPDFTAWLLCVGTNVNYPVVHGADNTYYLTHLFDYRQNGSGSLFIDFRNSPGFADRNTIIYGHNMRNHSMFWTLTRYKDPAFYRAHPTFRLLTSDGNYEIQLFAGYVASTANEAWRVYFASDDDFLEWVGATKGYSAFSSDVSVEAGDRVVTLSTCAYDFDDARYVLFGKLVPYTGG